MIITRQYLRERDACYSDDQIASLVPPEGLTPLQICDLDIPVADRLWVLLHEDCLPARTLRLLAATWARQALERERAAGREPDPRSWAACDVAERYARGEATDDELATAWDAAWDAAGDAAGAARAAAARAAAEAAWAVSDAVRSAARAAWNAAMAAARAAAWDAAGAAAGAAARDAEDAARDAAWEAQIAAVRVALS